MAIIGKLRKHSALIVILIGVAIAGFVLQDLFRKGGRGRGDVDFLAKIGNEKIARIDFDQKVEEQIEIIKQNQQKENLTSAENFQAMAQAWERLERQMIMQKEFEELGLAVEYNKSITASISPEELYELMLGNNMHPYIAQTFTDPNTGKVNKQQIQNIVENFDQLSDEDKIQWKRLEQGIKEDRLNTKYNNLVEKAFYMPKAFLQRYADEASQTAKLRFFGIKYQTISDSAVTVAEEDYKKFYEDHKYEYEQEKSCDIDYVIFEVVPSKEDLEAIKQKVESLYNEFQALAPVDVESYVKAHSDETYDSSFFKKGQLSVKLDSFMFASDVGAIIPPYQEDKAYYMARLVQIKNRPDSLKASHILIAYKEAPNPLQNITRTKDQAKKIADSLYEVVKKDAKIFGTLASVNSDFPTANKDGGDLGWIVDGDNEMKFFFDSAYVLKTGEVKVLESSMGYHVLYLTDKKESYKKVKVAVLKKDIKASSETFNKYLTDASAFAGENRTAEQFEKTVAEKGLNKRSAQFVREMDYSIPGLESARGIIRWAFNKDTKTGTVSEQVFDDDGKYIVVVLKEKREKGIAPLEQVKTYIEPLVKREKKAEKIVEQINTASGNDLYQIAAKINAVVDTVDALTLSAYNFPDFGPEPELIGTIFTLNKNSVSKPIKGKMAVYKVVVDDFIQPPAQINTDMVKMQLASYFRQRVSNDLFKAIKDKTEIVDNRIFFY